MTPIINPWAFYAMSLCENLGIVSAIIAFAGMFIYIAAAVFCFLEGDKFETKKATKALLGLCIAIAILCPSEKTILKMIVAQNVTYERVEMVGETVKDVYEDIISLVDGDKEEEE